MRRLTYCCRIPLIILLVLSTCAPEAWAGPFGRFGRRKGLHCRPKCVPACQAPTCKPPGAPAPVYGTAVCPVYKYPMMMGSLFMYYGVECPGCTTPKAMYHEDGNLPLGCGSPCGWPCEGIATAYSYAPSAEFAAKKSGCEVGLPDYGALAGVKDLPHLMDPFTRSICFKKNGQDIVRQIEFHAVELVMSDHLTWRIVLGFEVDEPASANPLKAKLRKNKCVDLQDKLDIPVGRVSKKLDAHILLFQQP